MVEDHPASDSQASPSPMCDAPPHVCLETGWESLQQADQDVLNGLTPAKQFVLVEMDHKGIVELEDEALERWLTLPAPCLPSRHWL